MSTDNAEFKPAGNLYNLQVIGYDETDKSFIVNSPATKHSLKVADTFAEMFPLWAGRVLITAENEKWALTAAQVTVGFATSVIMAPAEASIERIVPSNQTPDGRPGILVQIYNKDRFALKFQLMERIGQCIMTCPTTAAFDGLPNAKRKLNVGRSLRLFGDGFQKKATVQGRKCWKIPVMEGDFIVEDTFGATEAVAGGNFLILSENQNSGLAAAEAAANAIRSNVTDVIMPFPGGICRAGSKAGSLKYKLKASTNHQYCPKLRAVISDSLVPENVNCVYEIVVNGLTLDAIKSAMRAGVNAAACVDGVVKISAGNYGGKLGPYKAFLKDAIGAS
jgi:formylmethanofuran--tetrahydromethanopterin N-formyltransferase